MFDLSTAYNQDELNATVATLISQLDNITQPKTTPHFPRDLDVINNVLETLVQILSEENMASSHLVCI